MPRAKLSDEERALKVQARNAAVRRLQQTFPDEFEKIMAEEHDQRGVSYMPRRQGVERARAEIERLLEKYPALQADYEA